MAQGVIVACAVVGILCNILALVLAFILFYTHRKAIISLFNGQTFTNAGTTQSRRDSSEDTQLQSVRVQPVKPRDTNEVRIDIEGSRTQIYNPTPRTAVVHSESERISEQTIELDEIGTQQIPHSEDEQSNNSYDAHVDEAFSFPSTHLQEMMVDSEMNVTSSSGEETIKSGKITPISDDDEKHSIVMLSRGSELPSLRFSDVFSGSVLDKMHLEGHRQAFMPYQESFKHFSVIEDTHITSQPVVSVPPEPIDQYETLKLNTELPQESLRQHANVYYSAYDNDAYLEMDDDHENFHHIHEPPLNVPSIYYSAPPEDSEAYVNLSYIHDLPQSPVHSEVIENIMTESFSSSTESLASVQNLLYISDLPNEPLSLHVDIQNIPQTALSEEDHLVSEVTDEHLHSYEVVENEFEPLNLCYHHDLPTLPLSLHVQKISRLPVPEYSVSMTGSISSECTEEHLRSYDIVGDQEVLEAMPLSSSPEIYESISFASNLSHQSVHSDIDAPLIDFSESAPIDIPSPSFVVHESNAILNYIPDLLQQPLEIIVDEPIVDLYEAVPVTSSPDEQLVENTILTSTPDLIEQTSIPIVHFIELYDEVPASYSPYEEEIKCETLEYVPDLPKESLFMFVDQPVIESYAIVPSESSFEEEVEQIETLSYISDLPKEPLHLFVDEPLMPSYDIVPSESSHEEEIITTETLKYVPDLPQHPYCLIIEQQELYDDVPTSESSDEYEDVYEDAYESLEYVPDLHQEILRLHVDYVPTVDYDISRKIHHVDNHIHTRVIDNPIHVLKQAHVVYDDPPEILSLSYTSELPMLPYSPEFHIYRATKDGIEHIRGSSPYSFSDTVSDNIVEEIVDEDDHIIESSSYIHENTFHNVVEDHLITNEPLPISKSLPVIEEEESSSDHLIESSSYILDPNEKVRLAVADILDEVANASRQENSSDFSLSAERDEILRTNPISSFVLDQMALQDDFMRRYNELLKKSFDFRYTSDTPMPFPLSTELPTVKEENEEKNDGAISSSSSYDVVEASAATSTIYSNERPVSTSDDLIEQLTLRNARLRKESYAEPVKDDINMRLQPISFIDFRPANNFGFPPISTPKYRFGTDGDTSNSTHTDRWPSFRTIDDDISYMKQQTEQPEATKTTTTTTTTNDSSHFHTFGQGVTVSTNKFTNPNAFGIKPAEDISPPPNFSDFQWHSDTLQSVYNKELNSDLYEETSSDNTLRRRR